MIKEKDVIDNRYEVTSICSSDGLYEVTDMRMRTVWVMKEISMEEQCANDTNLQKDTEELIGKLEQMKKINHRFFPKVMELIRKEGSIYVIMEKVSGTVANDVEKKKYGTREIVNFALQFCDGLEYMEQSAADQQFIHWKHGLDNLLIEGGSVRVQDFELFTAQPEEEKQDNIKAIGEFVSIMLSGKVSGKLKKIMESCKAEEFSDYKELAEALERYVLEQVKKKRWKKRSLMAASAMFLLAVVGIVGINGAKILSKKKSEKVVEAPTTVPTATAEVTQAPKRTSTPVPATKKPTESPVVTKSPEKTKQPEKKEAPTADPKKIFRTSRPVVTAAPRVKPKVRATAKPKPKATKKPESKVDIELEDNNMEIIVE